MYSQLALLALAFSVISGAPTGLHFDDFAVSETATNLEIGSIECLDGASPTTFTIDNAEAVPFELSPIGSSNIASLTRTDELDYDTGPDHYLLEVTCTDSSGSASGNVTVRVLPENEHLPQFSLEPPVISISEITPAGTVLASQGSAALATITVSDDDRGEDGVLKFRFSATTDDAIELTHFEINATSGTISLTNSIDVDIDFRRSVDLQVLVCDGDRLENLCPVIRVDIVIESVNEFAPQFSRPNYATTNPEYSEGEYREEVIATVACTDTDTEVGELKGLELLGSLVPLRLVELSRGQAHLVLNGSLDYEKVRSPEVEVKVVCSDNGEPAKTATAALALRVKALDDNLPEFSRSQYEVAVDETLSVGSQVLVVVCRDKDYGAGDLAGIHLLNASNEVFKVDPETGRVTLSQSLDYDAGAQSYQFSVVCNDSAGNEVTAGVNLTVLPVNDERVEFARSEYQFSVDRLELPGKVVGRIETLDSDLDPQQVISYSIEDNPNFSIDSTGQIVLEEFIFFLEGDHFRLSVGASDGANEEARAVVVVAVEGYLSVLDIVLIIAGALALFLIIFLSCCGWCFVRNFKKSSPEVEDRAEIMESSEEGEQKPEETDLQTGEAEGKEDTQNIVKTTNF